MSTAWLLSSFLVPSTVERCPLFRVIVRVPHIAPAVTATQPAVPSFTIQKNIPKTKYLVASDMLGLVRPKSFVQIAEG